MCPPDFLSFGGGLPLVVIELKKPGVPSASSAFVKLQQHESALRSSRRGKVENCGSL